MEVQVRRCYVLATMCALLGVGAARCAADGASVEAGGESPSASATPSASASASTGGTPVTGLPSPTRATGLPSVPSDPYPLDAIAGRVIADSSGPCYRIETDDGKQFALYDDGGRTLTAGVPLAATGK